jgi:hypothetical protein
MFVREVRICHMAHIFETFPVNFGARHFLGSRVDKLLLW